MYTFLSISANLKRLAITKLSVSHPYLTEDDFEWASNELNADYKENYIKGLNKERKRCLFLELPLYELGLLVAMDQLQKKEFTEYHFEHIFNEYKTFANKYMKQHEVKKELAWKVN